MRMKMNDTGSHHKELVPLLRQAAERFLALGHMDIWDSDEFTDDLGRFCNQAGTTDRPGKLSMTLGFLTFGIQTLHPAPHHPPYAV